jgi:hypothetical protein
LKPRLGTESSCTDSSADGSQERSANGSQERLLSILGSPFFDDAHQIPHSPICSTSYGIIGQAALGVDFEATNLDKETLSWTLQQVICGRSNGQSKASSGSRYSPFNLLRLPRPNYDYFDDNPALLVLPILDLQNVQNWNEGNEYWVMCIARQCAGHDATNEEWYEDKRREYDSDTRLRCSEEDIRMATLLLGQFVKAHASVLSRERPAINPLDLFHGDGKEVLDRKKMSLESLTQLKANNEVKVPSVKRTTDDCSPFTWQVMKVRLTGRIPDPVLVAIKAAVSWSSRCGQKLLPTCPEGPDIDSEQEELYALGREEHEASMAAYYRTFIPTTINLGVSSPHDALCYLRERRQMERIWDGRI